MRGRRQRRGSGSAGSSGGGAAGAGSAQCESDADCVVCDIAVVNGMVQCCMPCGMVVTADRCEQNRELSGQCAAVLCPAIACASEPVPRCNDGTCSAAPQL